MRQLAIIVIDSIAGVESAISAILLLYYCNGPLETGGCLCVQCIRKIVEGRLVMTVADSYYCRKHIALLLYDTVVEYLIRFFCLNNDGIQLPMLLRTRHLACIIWTVSSNSALQPYGPSPPPVQLNKATSRGRASSKNETLT